MLSGCRATCQAVRAGTIPVSPAAYIPRIAHATPALRAGCDRGRELRIEPDVDRQQQGVADGDVRHREPPAQRILAGYDGVVVDVFDRQMDVFATSARVLDDGVIDPRDTRTVLATVLATCRDGDRRTPNRTQFSVARP